MTSLRTFTAFDIDGKSRVNFHIDFITPVHYNACIDFMNNSFLADEPMARVRNFKADSESMQENTENWRKVLAEEKISIACFKEGNEEIVGVNFLTVKRKGEGGDVKIKSKNLRDLFDAMNIAEIKADIFNTYKVDTYLAAMGLGVHSEYRGRGIAAEMLKARVEVMNSLGLSVTSTQFTGEASQKAAIKAGFVENCCVTYDEIFEINKELLFSGIDAKSIKTMSLKIEKC